ncbi:MAG: glutamine synthetase family protein [Ilumatobacteraceae bacterium]
MTSYDRLRVLAPDHLGLARGKYLPWRIAERGTGFCVGTWLLDYQREILDVPIGIDPTGFPDVDAVYSLHDVRPCWEDGTGVVIADLEYHGEPYTTSARHALRRAIADWTELGYRPKIGIELEAYVFEPDDGGGWRPRDTPSAFVYGTGVMADPDGLIAEIMRRAEACGLPVETINSEFDFPQWELTLEYGDALAAVDDIFLFQQLARETAFEFGLRLTFMGKPIAEKAGSGLHVNLSLTDAHGDNALADPESDDGISTLARQCIAGLVEHHRGLAALCAPTVNAYKRLQIATLSGVYANWGYDHRCATVRVPAHRGTLTRVEHRMPDGAANPYIAAAAVLQAARLGVIGELVPPPPETGDGIESINTDVRVGEHLGAALDDLEADTQLVGAIGPDLVANLVAVKRHEWASYLAAEGEWSTNHDRITDWERAWYFPFH